MTFLSHFALCLGVCSGAFFAWENGVPQTIWANDLSTMTSVIGVLFVSSSLYIGWLGWGIDGQIAKLEEPKSNPISIADFPSAYFGHLMERLCVMSGFVGTAIGLSLQARALAGGATSFTALATSLYTTACGGVAAALIAIMTFNLEAGMRRVRR